MHLFCCSQAAEEHLVQVVSASSDAAMAELKGDPKDLNAVLTSESTLPCVWDTPIGSSETGLGPVRRFNKKF
jgi:hypothetical protein